MNYNLYKYSSNSFSIERSRRRRYRKRRRRQKLRFLMIVITLSLIIVVIFNIFTSLSLKHKNNIPVEVPSNNSLAIEDDKVLDSDTSESVSHQPEEENISENDYSALVPMSEAVDASYFDDAVFIGDSRTEGFILFTGLSNATAYTHKGLMVDTAFTNPVVNMNSKKISVMEALKKTSFSKVYIMLGINETGWPYSNLFIQKYGEIINEVKNINPEAIIYVQSILPVSQKISSSHSYLKNSKISEYNLLIQQMAKEKEIYYINSSESVASSDGYLPEEASFDGIHLKKDYCDKCLEYLKTHTVNVK